MALWLLLRRRWARVRWVAERKDAILWRDESEARKTRMWNNILWSLTWVSKEHRHHTAEEMYIYPTMMLKDMKMKTTSNFLLLNCLNIKIFLPPNNFHEFHVDDDSLMKRHFLHLTSHRLTCLVHAFNLSPRLLEWLLLILWRFWERNYRK